MGLRRCGALAILALTGSATAQGFDEDILALFREIRGKDPKARARAVQELHEIFLTSAKAYIDDASEKTQRRAAQSGSLLLQMKAVYPGDEDVYFRLADAFLERGKQQSAEAFFSLLARRHVYAGRTDEARAAYTKILDGPPTIGRARARFELAQVERLAGDIPRAEELLESAAKVLPELDDKDAAGIAFHIEAQHVHLLLTRGLNTEAYVRVRRLGRRVPPGLELDFAKHEVDVLLSLGRSDRALRACEKSLQRWPRDPGLRTRRAQAAIAAGRGADARGREKLFDDAMRDASQVRSSRAPRSQKLRSAMLRLEALEARGSNEAIASAAAEIQQLAREDDPSDLPYLAHATALESATMFDSFDESERAAMRTRLQSIFDQLVARWRKMPPRRDPYPFLHYQNRRLALGELLHTICSSDEEDRTTRALEQVLELHRIGSIARRGNVDDCTLDEVRRHLTGKKRGVLVYAFAWRRSIVFAMDGDTIQHAEVEAGRNEIRDLAKRSVTAILAGDGDENDAKRLAELVVPKPLRALLAKWKHVTVVSSHDAGHIPFAELPLADGEPLRTRTATTFCPSLPAGVLVSRRRTRDDYEHDFVVLSAPNASDRAKKNWTETARAPAADPIVESAVRHTDEERVEEFEAEKATLESLISDEAASARVVTVLAHGVVDEEPSLVLTPSPSSDDGLVGGSELHEALRRRSRYAPLVVLFACGTAQGAIRSGDDTGHRLASAFLEAGARAVVVAPGTLMRNEAWRFAAVFQELLASEKLAPAEALRQAQQRLDGPCGLLHLVGDGVSSPF